MIRQVLVLVSVLCCSVAQWKSVPAQEVQRKPNIVILFIDDLGYGDLACFGNKRIPTPHIDSLAADGVRCTMSCVKMYGFPSGHDGPTTPTLGGS